MTIGDEVMLNWNTKYNTSIFDFYLHSSVVAIEHDFQGRFPIINKNQRLKNPRAELNSGGPSYKINHMTCRLETSMLNTLEGRAVATEQVSQVST